MSDRNELRRLAQKATKGNWYLSCGRYIYSDITVNDGDEEWRPVIAMTDDDESQVNYESNAAFIAAANPTAVLELLDEIERLRAVLDAARAMMKYGGPERFGKAWYALDAAVQAVLLKNQGGE